jgi:hypothetical protein
MAGKGNKTTLNATLADAGIVCAFTGKEAQETDLAADDRADSPLSEVVALDWIRVTVNRTMANPEYVALVQSKEALSAGQVASALAQAQAQGKEVSPEERRMVEAIARRSSDAQYHSILRDTPKIVTIELGDVWISPPERDKQVEEAMKGLFETLGISDGGAA